MKTLVEKIEVQGAITFIIVFGSIAVYMVHGVLPDFLQMAFSLVLGFYFGNRAIQSTMAQVVKTTTNGQSKHE